MDDRTARRFLAEHHRGVLMTLRRNGRPQASNIVYGYAGGLVRISVTADRAKARNLERDRRASLHVTTPDFWQWLVAEGEAALSPVSEEPGDAVGRELAELYEAVRGEPHPDWDEFHRAMVAERRLVVRLEPHRFYGQLPRGAA